jgi:hypothetical protein
VKGEKSEQRWLEELERVRNHWGPGPGTSPSGRVLSGLASKFRRGR